MKNGLKVKLACAPIHWLNEDLPEMSAGVEYERCLSEIALAGFAGTEYSTRFPENPIVLRHELELRKLQICNGWFSCHFTSDAEQRTVDDFATYCDLLRRLDVHVVGPAEVGKAIHGDISKPLFSQAPKLTNAEFDLIAKGLNRLGEIAQSKGLTLAYHYHLGTGIQTFEEIERLLSITDPNLVHLLFDTGHAVAAGIDPVELLQKYHRRVRHVHLKDVRNSVVQKVHDENLSFLEGVKLGMFTVPGDGNGVDVEKILAILDDSHYEGWLVVEAEQDPHRANPLEYAQRAYHYLRHVLNAN